MFSCFDQNFIPGPSPLYKQDNFIAAESTQQGKS